MDNRFICVGYEDFAQKLEQAKDSLSEQMAWRVAQYSPDQLEQSAARCYATNGGSVVAVTSYGEILSLCRHGDDLSTHSIDLVEFAKECGGYKLDCYAGFEKLYKRCGFEEIGRVGWDDRKAPSDWQPAFGREDTITFELPEYDSPMSIGRERRVDHIEKKQEIVALKDHEIVIPQFESSFNAYLDWIARQDMKTEKDAERAKKGLLNLGAELSKHNISLEELNISNELLLHAANKLNQSQKERDLNHVDKEIDLDQLEFEPHHGFNQEEQDHEDQEIDFTGPGGE